MPTYTHVFYSGQRVSYGPYVVGHIDGINPETQRGIYCGKALEEIRQEYPDARILTCQEAAQAHDRDTIAARPPERITEDRFHELLNVLPPCRWHRGHQLDAFHMSELESGAIALWVVRIGDQYATLRGLTTEPHSAILDRAAAFLDSTKA